MWKTFRLGLVLGALTGTWPTAPAEAQAPVDLALVLAVDVSLSMDLEEQKLQRDGYVAALRDPAVRAAIRSGLHGRIALTYFEWAGSGTEKIVIPWRLIDSDQALDAFSDTLAAAPVNRARMTSISNALDVAAGLLAQSGYAAMRRVVDVSGDGPNNAGRPVVDARQDLVASGVVINGLPIILKPRNSFGYFDIDKLDAYYEGCVIGGPGAFVIPVRSVAEFAPAIRRKLILEISGVAQQPRLQRVQSPGQNPLFADAIDCEIGEKMRRRYLDMDGILR